MEDLDIFSNLPDTLKNIIIRKSATCESLTDNGKKCMGKLKYSVSDYMFSAQELKKEMMDCSDFCLKHILELILKGELLVGYETKEGKNIENISRRDVIYKLYGDRPNGGTDIGNDVIFTYSGPDVSLIFNKFYVEDVKKFKKEMIKNQKGYPFKLEDYNYYYAASFPILGLIPDSWKIFIIEIFKGLKYIKLNISGSFPISSGEKIKNGIISLGNMNIKNTKFENHYDVKNAQHEIEFTSKVLI